MWFLFFSHIYFKFINYNLADNLWVKMAPIRIPWNISSPLIGKNIKVDKFTPFSNTKPKSLHPCFFCIVSSLLSECMASQDFVIYEVLLILDHNCHNFVMLMNNFLLVSFDAECGKTFSCHNVHLENVSIYYVIRYSTISKQNRLWSLFWLDYNI